MNGNQDRIYIESDSPLAENIAIEIRGEDARKLTEIIVPLKQLVKVYIANMWLKEECKRLSDKLEDTNDILKEMIKNIDNTKKL